MNMHERFDGGRPSLVLFDLDGTLVDSVPDLAAAVDAMLNELGHPAAGEVRVRVWVGNGAAVLVRRALAHVHRLDEDQVQDDAHQQALECFLKHYRRLSGQFSQLYPGVQTALQALTERGIALALVTNKPAEFVPHLLRDLQLEPYFDVWLGGDSLPQKKPDPAPLLHLLEQFEVSPAQALMVGDSRSDMLAGKAAGVATLGVTYGYNHGNPIEQEAPDWVTDNLAQAFDGIVQVR